MPFVTSKKKNFLFVHIPKSAGMSVYYLLEPYADPRKFGPFIHPGPHSQANTLRKEFGANVYDSYYKFAFVRNPWARLHSYYYFIREHYPSRKKIYDPIWEFRNGSPLNKSFNDWVLYTEFYHRKVKGVPSIPAQKKSQLCWITDDDYDKTIVDYIGRVENFDEDWKIICDHVNIPYKKPPVSNTSKHGSYQDAYNQEAIDFVAHHFKREIDMFGYTF